MTPDLARSKMPRVGTTIFTEMSALATQCGALNVAQGFPDLETPKALRKCVAQAMEHGHNQYAPMAGNVELRRWIAEEHYRGVGYDMDAEITIGAGASSVLFAAMTALLQPGDEVVVQDPCYDLYIPVAELNHAHVVRVPLLNGNGEINASGMASAITPRTRLVVINSPHNPTGRVNSPELMEQLAQALDGTQTWLLSDEVYGPMVHDNRTVVVPWKHPKLRERTIAVGSFGKLFHCTGWKIGWVAAPATLTAELRKIHQYDVFSTGAPIQSGLASFLNSNDAKEHLDSVGPIYAAKRNRLLDGLKGSGFSWTPAHGGYFQVLGVERHLKLGETDGDLARRWTREHGIATIPMGAFGDSWEPAVRVCFAKEDATIDQAIAMLRAIPLEDDGHTQQLTIKDEARSDSQENIRVLAIQSDLNWNNPQANRNLFSSVISRELASEPADLVVLPEMFTTGFDMNPSMADVIDDCGKSDTSGWMLDLAETHGVAIVGSVAVESVDGTRYNRMWMATPEGKLHAYDKRHLFTLAGEHHSYQAGHDRVEVVWRGWRILLQICYDLRFPGFVRNHGPQPYDLAIYVANWPKPRREAWRTLLQARAIENQCFVVGVNRCGTDGNGHQYAGDSMVVDFSGAVLADAGDHGNPVKLRASMHRASMKDFRKKLPFLEDADRFGVR